MYIYCVLSLFWNLKCACLVTSCFGQFVGTVMSMGKDGHAN